MSNLIDKDLIPIKRFFFVIRSNWSWFAVSLLFFLLAATIINRYSPRIYKNTVKLRLNTSSSEANPFNYILNNNQVNFDGSNYSDKIFTITSYPLVYKTVKDLNLNIEYFVQGNVKKTEAFSFIPIIFDVIGQHKTFGKNYSVKIKNQNEFILNSESIDNKLFNFGEVINDENGSYRIILHQNIENRDLSSYPEILIQHSSPHYSTRSYINKIDVKKLSKDGSIIDIIIKGEDVSKEVLFLNKLCENYINYEIDSKNTASLNTIKFIDKQLTEIKDSLDIIEIQLQQFKKNNGVVELSVESEKFYSDINALKQNKSEQLVEKKYLDYLSEYLSKELVIEDIIVPISYGVSNQLLNDLISDLVELQLERNTLNPNGNLVNPVIFELDNKIEKLKVTLEDVIKNLQSKNELLLSDFNDRISDSQKLLSSLPSVERKLVNIKRHYDLSESVYLLLLTKRTEAGIIAAGNVSDASIVEPSISQSAILIAPNSSQNIVLAIILGLFTPLTVFTLLQVFYSKISNPSEVQQFSNIPYLGHVANNISGYDLIVNDRPKSMIAESFRNVKSNIEFILPKTKEGKVLLFTSSISGEGKTFCAKNLATLYALSGKKSIIIGADLRKPRLFLTFDEENTIGLSTFLSDTSSREEIIKKSNIKNLDYVASGPVPPNPSELLSKNKMKVFIDELKNEYDYVIIDTPPVFMVSDSLALMEIVDLNIYLVRQNYTRKELIKFINDYYDSGKLTNLSLLLNDTKSQSIYGYNNYGYYNYAYNYPYENHDYYDDEN
ncbi:MAG: polysaccharide biosynthesis tyrosine autokinase [Flavobacteriales bacterium]